MIRTEVKQAIKFLVEKGNLLAASRIVRCLNNGSYITLSTNDIDWAIKHEFEILEFRASSYSVKNWAPTFRLKS